MIHLALTIASALFLSAFAATVCWLVYAVVGFIFLGTRELCKFLYSELVLTLREDWEETKKIYRKKP